MNFLLRTAWLSPIDFDPCVFIFICLNVCFDFFLELIVNPLLSFMLFSFHVFFIMGNVGPYVT